MRHILCLLALVATALGAAGSARAQAEPVPAEPVLAPPPVECFPKCRSGFLCQKGSCISECNPPCPPGDQCRGGECYPPAPPPAAPPSSWSDQRPPSIDPRRERHDGFMLRLALGFGYASTLADATGDEGDVTISGAAGSFSFDIGGAIAENLVLHFRFADLVQLDPKVSVEGDDRQFEWSFGGFMLGPALSYYIMPANVYLTLALGLSWLSANRDRSNPDLNNSDTGFATNLDVGKEWWVSDNWGLGLSARFWWTHATDDAATFDMTYNMLGATVQFSATYN